MNFKHMMAAVLTSVTLLSSFPTVQSSALFVPKDAVASVTVDGVTSYYYNDASSGGAQTMWNTAVSGTSATVILYQDWVSSYGTRLGEGAGFIYDGVILVPSGHEITIDLNGCSINRNLEFAIANGEVIHVENGATLNITDMNATSGKSGSITGGNSLDGAGGIYVETGGTVNLWGGNIEQNQTIGSGGGVLLVGEGSTLSMSGGSILNNSAEQCGGAVALSGGTFKFVTGQISGNHAQSGGGVYAQAGKVELSGGTIEQNTAVHGGGVLVNNSAELTLKGKLVIQSNIASGESRMGGGILAMCDSPIQIGGKPMILNNSADSIQSNLVFWQDSDTQSDLSCYVQNLNTNAEAKIGVSLSGKTKEVMFAPAWTGPDCFICDAMDYTLENREGNLILHRTSSYFSLIGNKAMILIIITGLLVILAVIAILVLIFRKTKPEEETEE